MSRNDSFVQWLFFGVLLWKRDVHVGNIAILNIYKVR